MTDEDSTGNPARLPIAERPELSLAEIARLECPADSVARCQWLVTLQTAVRYGLLPARAETRQRPGARVNRDWLKLPPIENPPVVESRYFISRNDYRTWRAAHVPKTAGPCFIQTWLDTTKPARLSDKEILELRQQGLTNQEIHEKYGVPKYQLTRINKAKKVKRVTPGPKPKVSD